MWYGDMFEQLELRKDSEESAKMSAYMKDNFPFLGIPKQKRTAFFKPYLKESKKLKEIDWDFVWKCYEYPYREGQYFAIEYVGTHHKLLTEKDLPNLEKMIVTKSWWETVDSIDSLVGEIVLKHPEYKKLMEEWSVSENMWLRRVAIDFQQKYKEDTDKELLGKIIANNFESDEFFINKAIGWSLREYSKVNPDWVRGFIEDNREKLNKLSIREGSKYI